jgi:hypothetical protein
MLTEYYASKAGYAPVLRYRKVPNLVGPQKADLRHCTYKPVVYGYLKYTINTHYINL